MKSRNAMSKSNNINILSEVIMDLSNFVQNGRVIASSGELLDCVVALMDIRDDMVGTASAKQRRTTKMLR